MKSIAYAIVAVGFAWLSYQPQSSWSELSCLTVCNLALVALFTRKEA